MAAKWLMLYYALMLKTFYGNVLIFSAIVVICVLSFFYLLISGEKEINSYSAQIFQTQQTIIVSEKVNSLLERMLSSQRGYLITKEKKFLDEYEGAKSSFSQNIAKLSKLTGDNPAQASRLDELRQFFVQFSSQLESRSAQISGSAEQTTIDNTNTDGLKSDISRISSDFLSEEFNILNKRVTILEEAKSRFYLTLLLAAASTLLIIGINAYLWRARSRRGRADAAFSDAEKEKVIRLAVEGTQDGIFDWDIKSGAVYYSTQFSKTLGYEPEEFEGTLDDFTNKLHPDEKQTVWEYLDLYLEGQLSEYSNTFRMLQKSGRWIWVQARGTIVLDKKGRPVRFVCAHRDISAAKEYELKLQEAKTKAEDANKAKSDFLAHMSHEIRTPLTAISGVAEILDNNSNSLDIKQQELVKVLRSSSITLKDVISHVLDFSRIESGELELEETTYSLQEAFEHIVSIISVRAREKNLDFSFDYDHVKDLYLYGDPMRLRQILINLIGNAVKFTDEGGVSVKSSQEDRGAVSILRIDIEDTGIGIADENLELVFERFKQADSSVSRKFGGTGLGLPIARKLAAFMGGDIEVKSELGKGSTFSVILPIVTASSPEVNEKPNRTLKRKLNEELRAIVKQTKKILLVEDYDGNIAVIGHMLEDMGIEFDVAKTGLEAVNSWNEHHYSMILMDIQMPEMDGFTTTKIIRDMEKEKGLLRTPIVGMTAHALVGDKDKCIEAGMDSYLPKPIVEHDFKSTILNFLTVQVDAVQKEARQ